MSKVERSTNSIRRHRGLRHRAVTGTLAAAVMAGGLLVAAPMPADATGGGIIGNGTIQLGIHDEGHLNVDGGEPSSETGTTVVGLRYVPTGAEFTAPGCLCEGWGAADATTATTGHANESVGGVTNLTIVSATFTATSAVTVTDVGTTLRVTHDYHPSTTPNLYEVIVTIDNISGATVAPRYRRVMDWDVEPTAFSEFVTIQGTAGATSVTFASDDGFASADPLSGPSSIAFTGDAVDNGPNDHGALFDFAFDDLAPGEDVSFRTFYGAAATEGEADAALAAVGAEVFSYGQPNTPDGPTAGTPNTAIFAFAGVGGEPVFPTVEFDPTSYSVNESAGSVDVTLVLSTESTSTVEVDLDTADGTATAGADYTTVNTTVTFAPGETSKNVTIPILDDSDVESDETFTAALTNATGAFLGPDDTATVTIVDDDSGPAPSADLSITKSDDVDPIQVGSTLTYTLGVANAGPDDATGVVVTDTLPSGVTYQDAASDSRCDETAAGSGVVECAIGSLAAGASDSVTIVVTADDVGTLSNSASVTGNEGDPDSANNAAGEDTEVQEAQEPPEEECVDLIAGQHTDVGQVCVSDDGSQVTVTYTTVDGCVLTETHLHVADEASDVPQTRTGSPIPGRFAHSDPHGATSDYAYTVPLPPHDGDVVVAAHAKVLCGDESDTAWGEGERFVPRGNWAMFFTYMPG